MKEQSPREIAEHIVNSCWSSKVMLEDAIESILKDKAAYRHAFMMGYKACMKEHGS